MFVIRCFPIEINLITGRVIGRFWWLLSKKHRERAIEHLRPGFPDASDAWLRRVARRSFEHFAQLYLVEMIQTPTLINESSWPRYIEMQDLEPAVRCLLNRERGTLLITPHFGNFELLGYTLARLGFRMTAVMRPLDNPLVNAHLVRLRENGGLRLLYKKGATDRAYEVLERGEPLSFIADQDAGRKGIFADFFNRPASWYKSIGLLAMQYRVPIVVGVAVRIGRRFKYRFEIERVIEPRDWESHERPLQQVTDLFAAALESAIRRHPEQYLWVHRRWKHQPRRRATS
jgi:KDO2-lipid IV(A) lauroyltransferase